MLRLLLAALCDPLYQSAERFDPIKSQWLRVATALDVPNAALLFYSLLNVTLGFDPVGFGLPYGNTFVSNAPAALMEHAAQVLIVLLDYGPPADVATNPPPPPPPAAAAPDAGVAAEGEAPPPPPDDDEAAAAVAAGPATAESPPTPAVENVFRNLLAAVDSPEELDFIFVGLSRLLNNVHEAQNTYMPGALMQVCHARQCARLGGRITNFAVSVDGGLVLLSGRVLRRVARASLEAHGGERRVPAAHP